ncbi:uncharacterized protein TEOVI_000377500 [Trypanosoma equiperdum]|uniref:Uncharacterized protein n=2 Tax=Trypanozoon TaxID=39700 RepID=Q38F86_TRYB2|nr:hypothetical protein, conserved [Trypanosoma brucei brucei TREU927]EAN76534.1 hypothetical protein, conserved [Trypanosoma brucei brucei TREU927]SCU72199.1 hypothetical protein, conserved [Trypanosoma equiperdum]
MTDYEELRQRLWRDIGKSARRRSRRRSRSCGPSSTVTSRQPQSTEMSLRSLCKGASPRRCASGRISSAYDPLSGSRGREVEYDSCLVHALLSLVEEMDEKSSCRSSSSPKRRASPLRSGARDRQATRTGILPSGINAPPRTRLGSTYGRGRRSRTREMTSRHRTHVDCEHGMDPRKLAEAFYVNNTSWKLAEAVYLHFVAETNKQQLPGICHEQRGRRG